MIRSREHALHMLAEAAELEHNLLCSYLYAAFSLKRGVDEQLEPHELEAVVRWRAAILHVCMEEMFHLAQVANLTVALGSRPHLNRPNLPVEPGYHPAGVQVALAPFDRDVLDHFIYLERPEGSALEDAASYRPMVAAERDPESGVLMPSAPDYRTIGEFYHLLSAGLGHLCAGAREADLFIGGAEYQLRSQDIGAAELSVVVDLETAQRALHLIVVQGEGAPGESEASHFETFSQIREEVARLTAARAAFRPARDVARNPVMRRPVAAERVHVTDATAAPILDAANAVYSLMLRCLSAVYDTSTREATRRSALLGCATGLMTALAELSDVLTRLPAASDGGVRAGVTFAMLRSTEGLVPGVDVGFVLAQRFERIRSEIPRLALPRPLAASLGERLGSYGASLLASH